jgi:HNH endonuclease
MRREFSIADQIAIVRGATDSSYRIHCSSCGVWCKSRKDYQIDHVIPEGMRPAADRRRKLVRADGQVLCLRCHSEKTPRDVSDIGEAKRREAYAAGLERPGKKKIAHAKRERQPYRPPAGTPALARRGFSPAGA